MAQRRSFSRARSRPIRTHQYVPFAYVTTWNDPSLPGLEPGRSYKVETLLIGGGPNGLFLPPWAEGIVMDGAALDIGVHTPKLMPEQSLVISVQEVSR